MSRIAAVLLIRETTMTVRDNSSIRNKDWWEKMVKERCGFTLPWLNFEKSEIEQYIRNPPDPAAEKLGTMFPVDLLRDVKGKQVLCLASGGGQQSVVFSLLGARVTVVDLTEGQLAGDQQAAAHYGYQVTTIQTDMRDLSSIEDARFDLVYQAPSMSYVPTVSEIYAEVSRVLKIGGLYRVAHTNPGVEFIETDSWDGVGYRISTPYTERRIEYGESGSIQFRHYLGDIFNGLLKSGFEIKWVGEGPHHFRDASDAEPGTWEHSQMYIPWIFAIVATRHLGAQPNVHSLDIRYCGKESLVRYVSIIGPAVYHRGYSNKLQLPGNFPTTRNNGTENSTRIFG
jgi:SAM-dependent methyltransferase